MSKKVWKKVLGYEEGDKVRLLIDLDWSNKYTPIKKGTIGIVEKGNLKMGRRWTKELGTHEVVQVIFEYKDLSLHAELCLNEIEIVE